MADRKARKPGRVNRRFYPRDAVLIKQELAVALRTSPRGVDKLDLPVTYVGERSPRYIWGQVLDTLAERAARGAA